MRIEIKNKLLLGAIVTAVVSFLAYITLARLQDLTRTDSSSDNSNLKPLGIVCLVSFELAGIMYHINNLRILDSKLVKWSKNLLDRAGLQWLIDNKITEVAEALVEVTVVNLINRSVLFLDRIDRKFIRGTTSKLLRDELGFLCPITKQLFRDPIISFETGLSYERSALEANNYKCPISNIILQRDKVRPNHTLRKLIQELDSLVDTAAHSNSKIYRLFIYLLCERLKFLDIRVDAGELQRKSPKLFELKDPISMEKFQNPVLLSDGHTYEREYYEILQARRVANPSEKIVSPFTGEELSALVIDNIAFRRAMLAIEDYLNPKSIVPSISLSDVVSGAMSLATSDGASQLVETSYRFLFSAR